MNSSERLVVYIDDSIEKKRKIIEVGILKILHSCIELNSNHNVDISSIYR